VRRCGSGNAFSNTCTIAAGGCDSAEQKADVRIQLTPAIAGIPVNIPQITGGQGVRVGSASNDAKIVLDDAYLSYMEDETDGQYVTDALGRVEGTYWGSNVVTGATSASPDVVLSPAGSAAGNIVTIHQAWDDADIWDPDTSDFGTVSFHPQITESGAAVHITGHQIEFAVAKAHVWRLDDAGSSYVPYLYTTDALDTSSDPGTVIISDPDLSRYHLATLDPTVAGDTGEGTYITNVDGPATATEVVDELELEGIDETVWTHQ
jgi:hypothetical protein